MSHLELLEYNGAQMRAIIDAYTRTTGRTADAGPELDAYACSWVLDNAAEFRRAWQEGAAS